MGVLTKMQGNKKVLTNIEMTQFLSDTIDCEFIANFPVFFFKIFYAYKMFFV